MKLRSRTGVIWANGVGKDGVRAFTNFGIETLIEFIKFYKEHPGLLKMMPRPTLNG